MSPRRWLERIEDILQAISEIQDFTEHMNLENFQNDRKTMRAVELDFIIIGETAGGVPQEIQEKYSNIPWHLMKGIRNQLVHAYFLISPTILWTTIEGDLPSLKKELINILEDSN
jgi:uncharacterized protein with HEPN domain